MHEIVITDHFLINHNLKLTKKFKTEINYLKLFSLHVLYYGMVFLWIFPHNFY